MYLVAQERNPKLGAYLRARRLAGAGCTCSPRMGKLRGLCGFGQDSGACQNVDITTGECLDFVMGGALPPANVPPGVAPYPLTPPDIYSGSTPTSPGNQPPSPPATAASILTQMKTQAVLDTNPLDYVSPQAAIAAGVDPNSAYAAWAQALSRYPTQQAAMAAGISPGVITQLWAQSRGYAAAPASAISPNAIFWVGGAAIALAVLTSGKKGRR